MNDANENFGKLVIKNDEIISFLYESKEILINGKNIINKMRNTSFKTINIEKKYQTSIVYVAREARTIIRVWFDNNFNPLLECLLIEPLKNLINREKQYSSIVNQEIDLPFNYNNLTQFLNFLFVNNENNLHNLKAYIDKKINIDKTWQQITKDLLWSSIAEFNRILALNPEQQVKSDIEILENIKQLNNMTSSWTSFLDKNTAYINKVVKSNDKFLENYYIDTIRDDFNNWKNIFLEFEKNIFSKLLSNFENLAAKIKIIENNIKKCLFFIFNNEFNDIDLKNYIITDLNKMKRIITETIIHETDEFKNWKFNTNKAYCSHYKKVEIENFHKLYELTMIKFEQILNLLIDNIDEIILNEIDVEISIYNNNDETSLEKEVTKLFLWINEKRYIDYRLEHWQNVLNDHKTIETKDLIINNFNKWTDQKEALNLCHRQSSFNFFNNGTIEQWKEKDFFIILELIWNDYKNLLKDYYLFAENYINKIKIYLRDNNDDYNSKSIEEMAEKFKEKTQKTLLELKRKFNLLNLKDTIYCQNDEPAKIFEKEQNTVFFNWVLEEKSDLITLLENIDEIKKNINENTDNFYYNLKKIGKLVKMVLNSQELFLNFTDEKFTQLIKIINHDKKLNKQATIDNTESQSLVNGKVTKNLQVITAKWESNEERLDICVLKNLDAIYYQPNSSKKRDILYLTNKIKKKLELWKNDLALIFNELVLKSHINNFDLILVEFKQVIQVITIFKDRHLKYAQLGYLITALQELPEKKFKLWQKWQNSFLHANCYNEQINILKNLNENYYAKFIHPWQDFELLVNILKEYKNFLGDNLAKLTASNEDEQENFNIKERNYDDFLMFTYQVFDEHINEITQITKQNDNIEYTILDKALIEKEWDYNKESQQDFCNIKLLSPSNTTKTSNLISLISEADLLNASLLHPEIPEKFEPIAQPIATKNIVTDNNYGFIAWVFFFSLITFLTGWCFVKNKSNKAKRKKSKKRTSRKRKDVKIEIQTQNTSLIEDKALDEQNKKDFNIEIQAESTSLIEKDKIDNQEDLEINPVITNLELNEKINFCDEKIFLHI